MQVLSVAIARTVYHAAGIGTHDSTVQSLRAEQPGVQLGHVVFLVLRLKGLLSIPIDDGWIDSSTRWSRSFCLLDLSKGDWTSHNHSISWAITLSSQSVILCISWSLWSSGCSCWCCWCWCCCWCCWRYYLSLSINFSLFFIFFFFFQP